MESCFYFSAVGGKSAELWLMSLALLYKVIVYRMLAESYDIISIGGFLFFSFFFLYISFICER